MTATQAESTNFFWHCLMAAKVLDEMPDNTVTRSYALRAVRMASLCARGRRGVQYASQGAIQARRSRGLDWERLGLIKEHVIPVSVICKLVRQAARQTGAAGTNGQPSLNDTQGTWTDVEATLFEGHPSAERIARIIQEWTVLAWITPEEERQFDDKARHGGISLRSRMPKDWDGDSDKLARYHACGITLVEI